MRGLLYKEFVQNKWNLLGMLISVAVSTMLLFMGAFNTETPVLDEDGMVMFQSLIRVFVFVCIFVCIGFAQTQLFAPDESRRWAYFMISTPAGERELLWVKYEFLLMTSGITLLWCWFMELLVCSISGTAMIGVNLYCMLFFVQILLRAIDIPFWVRFGSKIGSNLKAFCFLGVLLLAIVYALFGDLSVFGSVDAFYDFVLGILSGEGIPGECYIILGGFPFAACAAYYASYRISCWLYRKGVAVYDK